VLLLNIMGHDTDMKEGGEKYDIFRHSPLRYLGYANEVGESFRYQYPKFVVPSYVVAFGYCLADAGTSGRDTYTESIHKKSSTPELDAVASTMDTLIWQSLASVTIPGATINMIVKASRFAVAKSPMVLPALVSTWLPTGIGLGSVPLIIHPIDNAVDWFMDSTLRTWDWKSQLPSTCTSSTASSTLQRRASAEEEAAK
jgi:fission process protein 1